MIFYQSLLGYGYALSFKEQLVHTLVMEEILYVRRVELEAERRLLDKASRVDLGHFDNSDWHDRLGTCKT